MTAIIITIEEHKFNDPSKPYIAITTHQPTECKHTTMGERCIGKLVKGMIEAGIDHLRSEQTSKKGEMEQMMALAYNSTPGQVDEMLDAFKKEAKP